LRSIGWFSLGRKSKIKVFFLTGILVFLFGVITFILAITGNWSFVYSWVFYSIFETISYFRIYSDFKIKSALIGMVNILGILLVLISVFPFPTQKLDVSIVKSFSPAFYLGIIFLLISSISMTIAFWLLRKR
jgi:hypothetical protein